MSTINSLALLGFKCAPFVFDLSSEMSHVSIRDQVVRGRLLARDLAALKNKPTAVLVVGAGFSGVSAALACAEAGMRVVVVDGKPQPFSVQDGVTQRFVGPFMYEWPAHGAVDQAYPPASTPQMPDGSILQGLWNTALGNHPMDANDLAKRARSALLGTIAGLAVPFQIHISLSSVDRKAVHAFVSAFARHMGIYAGHVPWNAAWKMLDVATFGTPWAASPAAKTASSIVDFDAVILGAGFGEERVMLDLPSPNDLPAQGLHFWENDDWTTLSANDEIGVFGAGDGALQDALRALTGYDHPLITMGVIRKHKAVDDAIAAVEMEMVSIEQEARAAAMWTQVAQATPGRPPFDRSQVDAHLDARVAEIADRVASKPGVAPVVLGALRQGHGIVYHAFRESNYTKAYMLNRFLLHLIERSERSYGLPAGRVRYAKLASATRIQGRDCGIGFSPGRYEVEVDHPGGTTRLFPDRIAVRYGPDPATLPGKQMVGLTRQEIAERTAIGQVQLPFVAHPR